MGKTITIRLGKHLSKETEEVQAHYIGAIFGVNKTGAGRYTMTHLETGLCIPLSFRLRRDCIKLVKDIELFFNTEALQVAVTRHAESIISTNRAPENDAVIYEIFVAYVRTYRMAIDD